MRLVTETFANNQFLKLHPHQISRENNKKKSLDMCGVQGSMAVQIEFHQRDQIHMNGHTSDIDPEGNV